MCTEPDTHVPRVPAGSSGPGSILPVSPAAPVMSRREVLEALSGLMIGILVAVLSSTIVVTSLPTMIADLGGGQASFTWVMAAALLAVTVSTPVWGKLADLTNRKLLVQLSLAVFVTGSALAGFAQTPSQLIGSRVLQGIGAGGLTALVQVVMAAIISPRERGRYMGLLGAVMAAGTVGGPLVGGLINDAWGWRWTFFAVIPLGVLAIVVLQRTLHLPVVRRGKVQIDYLGTLLVGSAASLLLVWVTLAGDSFAWASVESGSLVGGAALAAVLFVWVESRVAEPLIPLSLFANRTVVLAVVASTAVGVSMFSTSLYLTQYLQLARGRSATESGLLTLPMVAGLLLSSIVVGQIISRTGVWKRYLVAGSFLLVLGNVLLSTVHSTTGYYQLGAYMFVLGAGIGLIMQNLVLVTQNAVAASQLGVGSSTVAFFRSLGGATGVAALGALLSVRLSGYVEDGLAKAGGAPGAAGGGIPDVSTLSGPVREVVQQSYGEAVADLFLAGVPLALVAVVAIAFLPNARLGTRTNVEELADELAARTSGARTNGARTSGARTSGARAFPADPVAVAVRVPASSRS